MQKIENTFHAVSIERRRNVSIDFVAILFACIDFLVIVLSSVISDRFYNVYFYDGGGYGDISLGAGVVAGVFFVFQAKIFDLYKLASLMNPGRCVSRIMVAWIVSILLVTALLFLFRIGAVFSRGAVSCFAASALVVLCLARLLAARALRELIAREAISGRGAVVIGEEAEMAQLGAPGLLMHFGLKELARFTVGGGAGLETLSAQELTQLDYAVAVARERRAEELVIALDWSRADLIRGIEERLRMSPLPVRLLPDRVVRSVLERNSSSAFSPLPSVELQRAPFTRPERLVKRACDVMLAIVAFILLSPLMLLSALAIKLDSAGPVIFRQRRIGFDGRVFSIYKFRTMSVQEDGARIVQTRRDDPRVTRVGRLLRQSSIDELPQLINVFRGDMSLVGPRPHAVAHDDQYRTMIAGYAFRHHVKPGITGWAQVKGQRGETKRIQDMERRVALDLWYIDNWSLALDLRIMWRTCFEVIRQKAY
jgi:putative colanic acid biosysnthesis UDP-glucose lipid carrier transferase